MPLGAAGTALAIVPACLGVAVVPSVGRMRMARGPIVKSSGWVVSVGQEFAMALGKESLL